MQIYVENVNSENYFYLDVFDTIIMAVNFEIGFLINNHKIIFFLSTI